MYIYLLKTNEDVGYDAYEGAVVIAENAKQARELAADDTSDLAKVFLSKKEMKLTRLGKCTRKTKPHAVLHSFHAG